MSLVGTLVLAASAASTATAARHGGFNPSSTLPWSAVAILAAPAFTCALVVFTVRTRRGAANAAQACLAVMLAAILLVGWARFRQSGPYETTYQWINLPVAFTGDERFQGFGIDLSFRLDHAALTALLALVLVVFACLVWHRVAGRGEQGPVRYQVSALLLILGATGVLVSGDAAELLAFWLVAGLATYLLLGHRWGTEGAGQRSRVALAVPFLGDMALLAAVAILYSRYGTLTLDSLNPELSTTLGVGLKSLTAAAVLLFAAVAVRACIWPFTAWQTGTVDAPPGAVALVAGVWPIVGGTLLLRGLPVIQAAGFEASRIAATTLAVAAVVGPLLALIGVELRRSALLASSGAVALALLGLLLPASVSIAFMAVLAVGAARAALLLASASAASAQRTVDVRALGGGWERMPWTTTALLVSGAVLALAGLGPALLRPRDLTWLGFAAGLALTALAAFRTYFAFAHAPLRRRRAFEPARVQEVVWAVRAGALLPAALGVVLLALGFFTPWVSFLRAGGHAVGTVGINLLWVVAPLAGVAAAAVLFGPGRDRALALCDRLGELFGAGWELVGMQYDRFFARPGAQVVRAVEDVGLPGVESGVSRAMIGTGRLSAMAERSLPWVPTVLGVAVVLVLAFGLLSQGIGR